MKRETIKRIEKAPFIMIEMFSGQDPPNSVTSNKAPANHTRKTHTHFDIGFAVNSVPKSKGVRETQGERVGEASMVEHGFPKTIQARSILSGNE